MGCFPGNCRGTKDRKSTPLPPRALGLKENDTVILEDGNYKVVRVGNVKASGKKNS